MKRIKAFVACILSAVMLLTFAACKKDEYQTIEIKQESAQSQNVQENTQETLTLGITDDVGSLHPLFVSSTQMASLNQLIHESLFELDAEGKGNFCLAKDYSYKNNPDGTVTWTLQLTENVAWHGNLGTLTSADVVYTIGTIQTQGGFYADNVRGITSVTAAGDYKVTIVTDRYYPDMTEKLTFPIIPQSYYASGNASTPMGCGAYYVADVNGEGESWMTLQAFENRWRTAAQIPQIEVKLYHDDSTLVKAYQQEEINVALTGDVVTGHALGAGHGMVYPVTTNQLEVLVPNMSNPALSNVLVRQAIGYAVNKTDIMTLLYAKRAVDVDVEIFTGHFLESAQSHRYDYNVQMARELLQQAGYRDGDGDGFLDTTDAQGQIVPLTLRLVTNDVENNTLRRQSANLIGESLAQAGIKVEVEVVPFSDIGDVLSAGNYDLVLTGIHVPYAPGTGFLYRESLNGYESPAIDAALASIDSCTTRQDWIEANASAQQILLDEYPVIPLFFRCSVLIADESITNVQPIDALDAFYNADHWMILPEEN